MGERAHQMNILLTGGAGFIGSHVYEELVKRNHVVTVVDDFSSGEEENLPSGAIATNIDISLENIKWKADAHDAIIHLAAQPSLINSIKDPHWDALVNIMGTIRLLDWAKGKRFVFASTCAFHGGGHPTSPYAASKKAAEDYVRLLCDDYSILRFSNVYGPRQKPLGENQLVPRALRHIHYGEDFEVYGDGGQTRDFIYVEDVAKAVVNAVEKDKINNTMEISTGVSRSVNDVLGILSSLTGYDAPFAHGEAKEHEPYRVVIRNHKAVGLLKWEPEMTLEQGLEKTVAWWQRA